MRNSPFRHTCGYFGCFGLVLSPLAAACICQVMARRFLSALLGFTLTLLPVLALAQAPLTLDEAIALAMARNPTLAGAQAAGREAAADSHLARSARLPQVEFSDAWQRSTQSVAGFGTLLNARRFTAADFALDRLNRPGSIDGFSRRVGVSHLVFDAGRTRTAVTVADRRADIADARVAAATADLVLHVTRTYGRIVAATSAVDAATGAVSAAREDQARAVARRGAGAATDADVLAMSVYLADVQQQLLQSQSELIVARALLNQLMGAPLEQPFSVALPVMPPMVVPLETLVGDALRSRPEMQEAELNIAVANAVVRDARAGWLPTVAAGAGYEWDGLSFGRRESAWTVSAAVRWNVSLGGAESARIASAHAALDRATAGRDAMRAAIALEVLTAREHWTLAEARRALGELSVAQSAESLRITRQRYAAGLAASRDVLAAAAAHLAATTQRISNDIEVVTAWAVLQRALAHASTHPPSSVK